MISAVGVVESDGEDNAAGGVANSPSVSPSPVLKIIILTVMRACLVTAISGDSGLFPERIFP